MNCPVSFSCFSPCFSYFCPRLTQSKWKKVKTDDAELSIYVKPLMSNRELQKKKYAYKRRTTEEKLTYQLTKALYDPRGESKVEIFPFRVPAPKVISKEKSVSFAVGQHQGSRPIQEDGYLLNQPIEFTWHGQKKEGVLFAVFDGHNDGGKMSKHLNEHFKSTLETILKLAQREHQELSDEVITDAFIKAFHALSESYTGTFGATATCMFAFENRIYFPNAGDSRAILVGTQKCYQLTEDASLDNPRFQKWYKERNHEFYENKGLRLAHCGLNMGRDLGKTPDICHRHKCTRIFLGAKDDDLKQGIIYAKKGDFIVLGTDGLFDAATNLDVAREVTKLNQAGASLDQIAQGLADTAGNFKQSDNSTALLIRI